MSLLEAKYNFHSQCCINRFPGCLVLGFFVLWLVFLVLFFFIIIFFTQLSIQGLVFYAHGFPSVPECPAKCPIDAEFKKQVYVSVARTERVSG